MVIEQIVPRVSKMVNNRCLEYRRMLLDKLTANPTCPLLAPHLVASSNDDLLVIDAGNRHEKQVLITGGSDHFPSEGNIGENSRGRTSVNEMGSMEILLGIKSSPLPPKFSRHRGVS